MTLQEQIKELEEIANHPNLIPEDEPSWQKTVKGYEVMAKKEIAGKALSIIKKQQEIIKIGLQAMNYCRYQRHEKEALDKIEDFLGKINKLLEE